MRTIAILTVGRSDYGRYRPILRRLQQASDVHLRLLVAGAHYDPRFGETWHEIADDGFNFETGLENTIAGDRPSVVGKTIGLGAISLSQAFSTERPDILVVLGDRYEMLSGPAAALGFNIPVVHIHGGAVTEGAIDEVIRHALTKCSHLHLVSTEEYARRVCQMGEEDWRVIVVGAPGLDELVEAASLTVEETSRRIGIDFRNPTLIVSFHPVTLELGDLKRHIDSVLSAVERSGMQAVFTYPNADPGHQIVIAALRALIERHPSRMRVTDNAGTSLFASLMRWAAVMVGNSSSGIVEAASFKLPVVNIGSRQDGKIKPRNIIDVQPTTDAILEGIQKALSPEFRAGLPGLVNPYGDGKAAERITHILRTVAIDDRLLRKKFIDR